jgi:hypothetical protein
MQINLTKFSLKIYKSIWMFDPRMRIQQTTRTHARTHTTV